MKSYELIYTLFHGIKFFKINIDFIENDISVLFSYEKKTDKFSVFILDLENDQQIELFFKTYSSFLNTVKGLMGERTVRIVELLGVRGSTIAYEHKD